MSTPSDLLTRAADIIRDTAAGSTAGPWFDFDDGGLVSVGSSASYRRRAVCTDAEKDGRWIALLNPAVAPALERALRQEAGIHQTIAERGVPFYGPSPLLDLARVILCEPEP